MPFFMSNWNKCLFFTDAMVLQTGKRPVTMQGKRPLWAWACVLQDEPAQFSGVLYAAERFSDLFFRIEQKSFGIADKQAVRV